MYKFITKKEYWDIEASGILKDIGQRQDWCLKSVQDAVAYNCLYPTSNKKIAEIGGGKSRLLKALARENTCFNIDEFQGVGNGPKVVDKIMGVKHISANIGNSSAVIAEEQYDVIFSISVVEHVDTNDLPAFFKDCHRILKPGGVMLHLVDVYLEGAEGSNSNAWRRVDDYASVLDNRLFKHLQPAQVSSKKDVVFSTTFATNPDYSMGARRTRIARMKKKREQAQRCSLLMAGTKVAVTTQLTA